MSPWSLYALDWCKGQPTNGGYGRVAIGSYAEDSHNYVSLSSSLLASRLLLAGELVPSSPNLILGLTWMFEFCVLE